jgi:glc operon protein GlcG
MATDQPLDGTISPSDDGNDRPGLARRTLTRRDALVAGAGLAAVAGGVATSAPAAAQPAAAAAEPLQLASVSLAQAQALLRAAEREARRIGVPMYVVVVDVCGDVKAASRQDGGPRAALVLAPLKAATALAFRTPTATLAERTTDPIRAQSFLAAGFTLLGGGVPVVDDGRVIGAVGVGGGSPEQDIQVAEAGLAALR